MFYLLLFLFIYLVTGGWVTHKESIPKCPPSQDFVKINKLAITHGANTFFVSNNYDNLNIFFFIFLIFITKSLIKNSEEQLILNK